MTQFPYNPKHQKIPIEIKQKLAIEQSQTKEEQTWKGEQKRERIKFELWW